MCSRRVYGKVKKTFIANIVFNVIALISAILALVFCIYICKLDMIPSNYLILAFIGIGVIYLILLSLTLPRKISKIIKGICCFFFIVNAVFFGYGIRFSDQTIDVLDKISYDLSEKEDYELKVLSTSTISSKEDLKGKKIGVFKNKKYDDVVKYLKKDVECELIDYDDPVKFFEDLSEGSIDGTIASDMKSWTITSQHLNGTPSATYGCYSIPKYYLYIMLQNKDSIKKNKEAIEAFLAGNQLQIKEEIE